MAETHNPTSPIMPMSPNQKSRERRKWAEEKRVRLDHFPIGCPAACTIAEWLVGRPESIPPCWNPHLPNVHSQVPLGLEAGRALMRGSEWPNLINEGAL